MTDHKIGKKYRSRWDVWTWLIVAIVGASCGVPFLFDDSIWPSIICAASMAFVVTVLLSVSYRIEGDKLLVYEFFSPKVYPIDKIKSIKPTDSVLAAPAAALTGRLAIEFVDRSVMKSAMPLVISPVDPEEFIASLVAINPNIEVS